MANPKLYFIISVEDAGVLLCPIKSQHPALYSLFQSNKVKKDNIANYNEYTKDFIVLHFGSYDFFMSEDYEWDPVRMTFNFNRLEEVPEGEYFDIQTYQSNDFKINQKYGFQSLVIDINSNNPETAKSDNSPEVSQEVEKPKMDFVNEMLSKYPVPSIQDCGMYISTFTWKYLVRNILKKKNTILTGPTGTGKTELVMKIAEILGIDCHVYDMGSMQDPLTDLLGSHRLENGSSVFDYAKFTEHVQKPGIIVLDELSRAPLMANNILFPCLDSRRELPIEIADSKSERNIKIHPDCVFIATANIGIEYSGTNDIDMALMNRFMPIRLDYMNNAEEIAVLIQRTGIHREGAIKIVNFANKIRNDYKAQTLTKSCSTRESIAMAEMVVDGFSYFEAINSVMINKYPDPNDEQVTYLNKLIVTM